MSGSCVTVSWFLLLCFGIAAVTIEQFVHLCRPDFVSKKARPPLKEAARFQFLARYLKGEGVDGLNIVVPATKGSMGGVSFYNFLISPYELLKISYISHKATLGDDLETYQRMVKPSRLKSIAAYIDKGGQFPTNIVINLKTKKNNLEFQKIESFENTTFGKLTLPGQYGSAWVIDG